MTKQCTREVLMLNSSRVRALKRIVRGKECLLDANAQSELNFLLKTGRCSPSFLRELLRDDLSEENRSLINEWLADSVENVPVDISEKELHDPEAKRKRNPELYSRLERLRAEQESREYSRMTSNVDAAIVHRKAKGMASGEFGAELRAVNKHLITLLNMVLTVAGAFAFGYKGLEIVGGGLFDLTARLIIGCVLGTVVFFADLYFFLKTMEAEG